MVDFIGVGAQKSGTSWAYACLYEHPEICAPIKEIHFFSRDRFSKGLEWYEGHFARCKPHAVCGEFSTSYLYSMDAPLRIHASYPEAKIIAILRNPVTRAISQYGNAIKAGEISETMSFETYMKTEPSVLEQGLYAKQLKRYYSHFDQSHMCIMIYEDIKKDPKTFMQTIYRFLNVDQNFIPSMLGDSINVARIPKHVFIERVMHRCSEFLRKHGLDRLVHMVRQSGIPDRVRSINTKEKVRKEPEFDRDFLSSYFKEDVQELSLMLGRDLSNEWRITTP